jgi:hypothetical protein
MTPFALALAASDPPKTSRNSFGPNKRAAIMAELLKSKKKSARAWNPWMMTK